MRVWAAGSCLRRLLSTAAGRKGLPPPPAQGAAAGESEVAAPAEEVATAVFQQPAWLEIGSACRAGC